VRVERVEAVRRAVLSLPLRYREAVVLCDLQELSYADAAGALGCAVGTVRSRLHRGRALLASKLRAPGFRLQALSGLGVTCLEQVRRPRRIARQWFLGGWTSSREGWCHEMGA
jgi:hypothetical protein